ncbi:hypothetical protein AGR6A_pAt60208 [Agrobacterium sp. NCPPB 925]|nr:hypothetical protein AGR6A_pAt60208 [Agrobacterium sp. NCPPB 925]
MAHLSNDPFSNGKAAKREAFQHHAVLK